MNCQEITTKINDIKSKKKVFDNIYKSDIPQALTLKKKIQVLISQLKEKIKPVFKIEGKEFPVFQLEIGGKTAEELEEELLSKNISSSHYAEEMLHSSNFSTLPTVENIHLVKLKVSDLGFKDEVKTDKLYAKAQELGLELCPAEVGPYQRLKDYDQPVGSTYNIAMQPIIDSDNDPLIFNIYHNANTIVLNYSVASSGDIWLVDHEFVFRISDKK